MNLWRRLWRWLVAPSLEEVAFRHWIPPHNSVQSFQLGRPETCFYCLLHESDPRFDQPCSRRRPDMTELA